MEGFDDPGVFFSDNFGAEENESQDQINLQAVKKKFKEFIRQYHTGNFNYKYRSVYSYRYLMIDDMTILYSIYFIFQRCSET